MAVSLTGLHSWCHSAYGRWYGKDGTWGMPPTREAASVLDAPMGLEWDKGGEAGRPASPALRWASWVEGCPLGDVSNCALPSYGCKTNYPTFSSTDQHPLITSPSVSQKFRGTTLSSLLRVFKAETQVLASLGSYLEVQEKNLCLSSAKGLTEFRSCGFRTEVPISLAGAGLSS